MHVFGHWAYWQNLWEFKGRQQEIINAMCLFNLALECVCVCRSCAYMCMYVEATGQGQMSLLCNHLPCFLRKGLSVSGLEVVE